MKFIIAEMDLLEENLATYIKYIYLNLLDNWVLHLESGRSIYVTCYEDNINEENTIYKINKLLADMN